MKLVNSNSFTATNTVRSAATITVLVLCLSAARGENLTVLDGQSYTNITEISKYPNQIHFTCDEKRISVAITNLPEEFLSKYAIKKPTASVSKGLIRIEIQTNKASELTGKSKEVEPTPQLDSILLQHTDSNLFVETNAQCGCTVRFWTKQFVLDVFNSEFYTGSASDGSRVEEDFQYGQEVALNQVFNKFLEWDNIASKNHAEFPF